VALGFVDILLLLVVAIQSTVIAYVHAPRWKAFILALPFPFTVASLSVGAPVNASHAIGLILLLLFTHLVKTLHYDIHVPIVPAIVVSALSYSLH
jgi:hypothetical protein